MFGQHEDTIIAPATGLDGGVVIVRLSGPEAIRLVSRLFSPAGGGVGLTERKLTYGTLHDQHGTPLDDCLAVIMRAPASFTGEDVAELHTHGGRAVTTAVLNCFIDLGARLAEPGEFSRRAFLNGRMDLAQAEALSDLVAAQTELGRRAALQQLRGGVSHRVREIRDSLVDAAAEIEAHLDFPEEDIPAVGVDRIAGRMRTAQEQIQQLLAGFARGRLLREGARVVLAGSPNAGKSSLFNALVGRERALVSPHPGTTRDTIESTIDIGGVAITLVDTAGLRESSDAVEKMGIERTSEELRSADLVLYVVDAMTSQAFESPPPTLGSVPYLMVLNKVEQPSKGTMSELKKMHPDALAVSATTRQGLDALVEKLSSLFATRDTEAAITITRARHAECLRKASGALERATASFVSAQSGELVMVELRETLIELGEILGERLDEQILDRIFSTFCLGK